MLRRATGGRESGEGVAPVPGAGGVGTCRVVARLLGELPSPPVELIEKAKVLDNFYVGTRSPNGHPEGPAFEHYGTLQSEDAIRYAGEIVAFVRIRLAGPSDG